MYERLTVDGHRAIAKVKHVVGELECRGDEPNRFDIASSGRKLYRTDPKIEGDALGEDIHSGCRCLIAAKFVEYLVAVPSSI